MTTAPDLTDRLRALVAFLPAFEAPGLVFGKGYGFDEIEPGVLRMPFVVLSETAEAFVRTCYDQGWVVDFDWPQWKQTDDAKSLARDRDSKWVRSWRWPIRETRTVQGAQATCEPRHHLEIARIAASKGATMSQR